ncbi:SIMPL domain-containing protein [Endozoicomonas atrinae]|uniref:SIMPL domain-containing protein n=1 Tax=Endozoicomonas atrinae TaxID=1333660 RepID=UPI000825D4C3|nr:SIMPL domain-containing protein [Endozoicomonas atrinae]
MSTGRVSALILGISIFLGLSCLGYLLANAAIEYKQYERSVTVKGLSERECQADVVIWPIQFSAADNDLKSLYGTIENNTNRIRAFLERSGIAADEISLMSPDITDKSANQYGSSSRPEFRYTALQTITIYSNNIEAVRSVMERLSDLGREGIVFTGGNYGSQPEYLFTRLNDVKPEMIEEATRKAREVAEKFASDSQSELGKIKRASQGQFSISNRDRNNPHIKKVRVVATIEYYLSD